MPWDVGPFPSIRRVYPAAGAGCGPFTVPNGHLLVASREAGDARLPGHFALADIQTAQQPTNQSNQQTKGRHAHSFAVNPKQALDSVTQK